MKNKENPKPILLDPKAIREFQERFYKAVEPELEKQKLERMKAMEYARKHLVD